MTYLSDGSPYKPEHTIITANGINPASVMSWIHREKPGSPAWEQRARQRFMMFFGEDTPALVVGEESPSPFQ